MCVFVCLAIAEASSGELHTLSSVAVHPVQLIQPRPRGAAEQLKDELYIGNMIMNHTNHDKTGYPKCPK